MTANFGRLFSDWMTDNYPDPRGGMTSWPSGWNDTVLESKEETVAWLGKFAGGCRSDDTFEGSGGGKQ